MKKKAMVWIGRIILGWVVGCSLFFLGGQTTQAATITGTWGTVPWIFEESTGEFNFIGDGVLGISDDSPWNTKAITASSITQITFRASVTAPKDSSYLFSSISVANTLTNMKSFVGLELLITTECTDMSNMFYSCISLTNIDLSSFNTSQVTKTSSMFANCTSVISLDLLGFDMSKVTNMGSMFSSCMSLKSLNLSGFNTSSVTVMSSMFNACSKLTDLNISGWDTGQVTDMSSMFSYCVVLKKLDITSFNTTQVTNMTNMFSGCSSLINLDVSSFDTSKVTMMSYMFNRCNRLTSLDLRNFNTSQVTTMSFMFNNCSSLINLDVSSFDTSKVTMMSYMFADCSILISLDLRNFNTSQVTTMSSMFANCGRIISLDVSSFDTSNVTTMSSMFARCVSVRKLDVSGFDTSNVTTMSSMFTNCSSLAELDLSNFIFKKISQSNSSNTSSFLAMTSVLKKIILNDAFPIVNGTTGIISLPTIPTTSGEYSGRWVATSGIGLGTTYANSTTLTTTYTPDKAGTYEWEPNQTSLTVKDTTLQTGDSWNSVDNLVTVTDAYGAAVDLSSTQITTTGTVNPQQAGTYTVTYRYTSVNKTVTAVSTITVVATPAHVTVQFVRAGQVLSENTVTLTGNNVGDTLNLTTDTTVQHQVQLLEAAGYEVTAPTNAAAYPITEANPTVQYQVTGVLRLQSAPDTIDFGTIAYSGKKERLDNPTLTGGALAISDTRSDTTTGWVLSAKLTQVMTNTTTNGVLSNALVYVRDATDYVLTTEVLPIYTKSDGGSLTVSDTWTEQTEGLKLEIDPATNQLDKGTYTGKILWLISAGTP